MTHVIWLQIANPMEFSFDPVKHYDRYNTLDFYTSGIESYRTINGPLPLDGSFEKLHYNLSLNDHDTFFQL